MTDDATRSRVLDVLVTARAHVTDAVDDEWVGEAVKRLLDSPSLTDVLVTIQEPEEVGRSGRRDVADSDRKKPSLFTGVTRNATADRVAVVTVVFEMKIPDGMTADDVAQDLDIDLGSLAWDIGDKWHVDSKRETRRRCHAQAAIDQYLADHEEADRTHLRAHATSDCPCCAAGGCPSCDAGHHAGERSHDFTGVGHSIPRATPDCAGEQMTPDRAAMIKQVASVIADRIIDWADEGDAASRYPIPPWTVYEEIARTILELPRV